MNIAGLRGLLCALTVGTVTGSASAADDDIGSYALDALPRVLEAGAPLPCETIPLVRYRGERMRLRRPARVHPAFAERLRRFEALVVERAIAHYGRGPSELLHLGTHNCRRIRRYPDWLSEHALGNAIDVAGFVFPRLARGHAHPPDLPRRLRAAFTVRIDRHWSAQRGAGVVHAAFLRDLGRRLMAARELFRVVLGPAYPGHHDHFHLDAAPYRVVEVF